jgi:hypothetical protein
MAPASNDAAVPLVLLRFLPPGHDGFWTLAFGKCADRGVHRPDIPIRKPFEWGAKPRSRIFCGDFHTPPKKCAFFQPFSRFFLAFCDYLGYSRCGPSFFGEKQG